MKFNVLDENANFLGLSSEYSNFEFANIVIQSLPYEHTSSYLKGSDKGPEAIIEASRYVEFYDEEIEEEICFREGICTLASLDFKSKINSEAMELIESQTKALLRENKFVVSLGAEHTVTYGIVKAYKERYSNLSVLQIDAHSDLRDSYESNPFSHACVMKRILDDGIVISQIGIRAQCKEEAELIKASSLVHCVYAHQRTGSWIEDTLDHLSDEVYLTIDADGFDPSITPGVGTPEPNGLLWDEVVELIRRLSSSGKRIVGLDVVEVLPKKEEVLTQYNMAKLVYKILGLVHSKKG